MRIAAHRLLDIAHQRIDRHLLVGGEQVAIGRQRRARGQQHALGLDARLAQRAQPHVVFRVAEAVAQHARDLLVGQAIARLDDDRRLHARGLFFRAHAEQPVGIDLEAHADARRAGSHRRNAAQLEARQRAAIGDQLALALHHVQRHRGLAVLEGGEVLRLRGGDRGVALDDALDQAAHCLQAQRQRDHVQQQQLAIRRIAGQLVGLDGGAERHHFIGVEIGQRRVAEEFAHRGLHGRHARRAADHHDTVHLVARDLGVAQHALHRSHRAVEQAAGQRFELLARDRRLQRLAVDRATQRGLRRIAQGFLRGSCCDQHRALVLRAAHLVAGLGQRPIGQRAIEIVAAECRIAAGGHHLEHAAAQAQQRDVEGAATEVVDGIQPFAAVLQPIGDGRGSGLVDQAQHVQARELRGVLRGLALRLAEQLVGVEAVLGALAQRGEDLGRHLDRRLHAVARLDAQHAGRVDEAVRQLVVPDHVRETAPHEALDRDDGVLGILALSVDRRMADLPAAAVEVAHRRRQNHASGLIGQAFGHAVTHRGDERMRRAEVDADGDAAVVGVRRLAGLGNLQQRHGVMTRGRAAAHRRPRRSAR